MGPREIFVFLCNFVDFFSRIFVNGISSLSDANDPIDI